MLNLIQTALFRQFRNKQIACCLMLIIGFGYTTTVLSGNDSNSDNRLTEQRAISGFTEVHLKGNPDVLIKEGKAFSVTVSAPQRLMKYVYTRKEGNRLVLGVEQAAKYRYTRKNAIIFTVEMPTIEGVILTGSGDIDVDSVKTDELSITLSGSGDIRFDRIEAQSLTVRLSGSGDIVAKSVKAEEGSTRISGSGDVELGGTINDFTIKVSGSGDFDGDDLIVDTVVGSVSGSADIHLKQARVQKIRVSGSGDLHVGH